MILVDANILIYAVNADAPLHSKAKVWLQEALSGRETVAFAWNVLVAFVRLTTKPWLFHPALSPETALDLLNDWLDQPASMIVHPGVRHLAILRELLADSGTAGNLCSDAHLAALAIEHGADLYSADADFARFKGLRLRSPFARGSGKL